MQLISQARVLSPVVFPTFERAKVRMAPTLAKDIDQVVPQCYGALAHQLVREAISDVAGISYPTINPDSRIDAYIRSEADTQELADTICEKIFGDTHIVPGFGTFGICGDFTFQEAADSIRKVAVVDNPDDYMGDPDEDNT